MLRSELMKVAGRPMFSFLYNLFDPSSTTAAGRLLSELKMMNMPVGKGIVELNRAVGRSMIEVFQIQEKALTTQLYLIDLTKSPDAGIEFDWLCQ